MGCVLKEARISRAAADLEDVDGFYKKGMQIPLVLSYDGEDVSVRCYEWSKGTPQICYTKRPASKTKGWFTVEVFGNMMKESARYFGKNPLCVMNRWFDNHYSVTADGFEDQSKIDYLIDYLDEHEDIPMLVILHLEFTILSTQPDGQFKCLLGLGHAFQKGVEVVQDQLGPLWERPLCSVTRAPAT